MESKIKSVSEFIDAIANLKFSAKSNYTQDLWFRGEGSINWKTPLVPTSYRNLAETFKKDIDDLFVSENIKSIEKNIQAEFNRRAHRYIKSNNIDNSQWNRYFLMQHYRIKTRLLDWTENAMLALFFAISNKSSYTEDSIVWVLKPFTLNNETIKTILDTDKPCMIIPPGVDSGGKQNIVTEDDKLNVSELTRQYIQMDFDKNNYNKAIVYYPLAIHPTYLDDRMTAQKTCFTIFGNKINGLLSNKSNSDFLSSVVIEGGATKKRMLNQLRILGIDHESILPDLDGIGESINSKFESNFCDNRETLIHVFNKFNKEIKENKTKN